MIKLPPLPDNEPRALIIYVPDDGNYHMIGCHLRLNTPEGWRFSKVIVEPIKLLPGFLDWTRSMQMITLNMRDKAARIRPGSEILVPILIVNRGVPFTVAADAYSVMNDAVLKEVGNG